MPLDELLDLPALWAGMGVPSTSSDVVHDWVGNQWPAGSLPALPVPGWKGPQLPLESDGFRAGAIEWAAFAIGLRHSEFSSDHPDAPAVMLELGASQAPWCLSWVRVARRLRLRRTAVA